MSAIQKLVLEQDAKRYVPVVPTHFYHVDPKEGIAILYWTADVTYSLKIYP